MKTRLQNVTQERAVQSVDILDIKFNDLNYELDKPADTTYWKYLLMSISGYELYLKTYRGGFEAKNVMEQILLNETFPRSVIYSINHLYEYFERLRNERNIAGFNQVDFMIGKLRSEVKFSTTDSIVNEGLHKFLADTKSSLFQIANTLSQNYFAHS